MDIKFEIVEGSLNSTPEVVLVKYEVDELKILLEPKYEDPPIEVIFDHIVGFRVLDEGNLVEFWDSFTSNDGWLFQIKSGGWLEQELNRSGFFSSSNDELKEYFIIGTDGCVNISSHSKPTVIYPSSNHPLNQIGAKNAPTS